MQPRVTYDNETYKQPHADLHVTLHAKEEWVYAALRLARKHKVAPSFSVAHLTQ